MPGLQTQGSQEDTALRPSRSCGAKRAAELAAFLQDEVVEEVGHAQWVFTIPKMLRICFLHHRGLLGALYLAAYETVKELMLAARAPQRAHLASYLLSP